jgi:hypothetical protein
VEEAAVLLMDRISLIRPRLMIVCHVMMRMKMSV